MQPCKIGDQPYSDASPNGECSEITPKWPWIVSKKVLWNRPPVRTCKLPHIYNDAYVGTFACEYYFNTVFWDRN